MKLIFSKIIKYSFIFLIYFLIPILIVIILYWPVYQKIEIKNFESKNEDTIKSLDLKINTEYLKFFSGYVPEGPLHEFCFKNNNKVYLIHADSHEPYIFTTGDISQIPEIKEKNVGAMDITLYYSNNSSDKFFRNINENNCEDINIKNLYNIASSTIEYKYVGINSISQIDLEDKKFLLGRIIGNSFIDTRLSKAYIKVKFSYFFLTIIFTLIFWDGIIKIISLIKKHHVGPNRRN